LFPIKRIGLKDNFAGAGDHIDLLKKNGLSFEDIVKVPENLISK